MHKEWIYLYIYLYTSIIMSPLHLILTYRSIFRLYQTQRASMYSHSHHYGLSEKPLWLLWESHMQVPEEKVEIVWKGCSTVNESSLLDPSRSPTCFLMQFLAMHCIVQVCLILRQWGNVPISLAGNVALEFWRMSTQQTGKHWTHPPFI